MQTKTILLAGVETAIAGDEGDGYFQHAESHGRELERLRAVVEQEVADDALCLDVGANIGLSVLVMARTRPRGRVVAIEPSPKNAFFLRRNLEAAGLGNVEVVEAAASDGPGVLRFHEAAFGAGSHVVGDNHVRVGDGTLEVRALALDSLFPTGGAPVGFCKIDCEGHEPEVLAGAAALLARDRPLLFMEFNAWTLNAFAGHSPAAFAGALWRGFEVRVCGRDGSADRTDLDALAFLHHNLVEATCVSDLLLRPRPGAPMPGLAAMTLPATALAEIESLRRRAADADAMRDSTSWRLTAPLRRAVRATGLR